MLLCTNIDCAGKAILCTHMRAVKQQGWSNNFQVPAHRSRMSKRFEQLVTALHTAHCISTESDPFALRFEATNSLKQQTDKRTQLTEQIMARTLPWPPKVTAPSATHSEAPLAMLSGWPSCSKMGSALLHKKLIGTHTTAEMRSARWSVSFRALKLRAPGMYGAVRERVLVLGRAQPTTECFSRERASKPRECT